MYFSEQLRSLWAHFPSVFLWGSVYNPGGLETPQLGQASLKFSYAAKDD